MTDLITSVTNQYLETYKNLLEVESIDENNIALSFPFHFASNHRIEVLVTRVDEKNYVISDGALILTELKASGQSINNKLRERLEKIGGLAGIKLIREYFTLNSQPSTLGDDIQKFLEATKTIGDVYFVHKDKGINEREIIAAVKTILDKEKVVYQEKYNIGGEIEPHKFNFYVPPNGSRALALAVLGSQNTHNAAQVWAFKTDDIKRQKINRELRIGIVYDTRQVWSDESKQILESRADLVLADTEIPKIAPKLHEKRH